jgi:hypothetical protein
MNLVFSKLAVRSIKSLEFQRLAEHARADFREVGVCRVTGGHAHG